MDTALKYAPLVSAVCASFMLLWTVSFAIWARMTATSRIELPEGRLPWWRRPIPVMLALVILAWVPSVLAHLDMLTTPRTRENEHSLGPTFSIQFAQLLLNLPQPCWTRFTDQSDSELGRTIFWVLAHGSLSSGPPCSRVPNTALPNADKPQIKLTTERGMIVHYKESFQPGKDMAHFFDSMGVKVGISNQLDDGSPNNLIWIDIGPGSPWK